MFRLLGFDVRVRAGFLFFIALIVFLNPSEFGLWLGGALFVFTLIHELGHAVFARRYGAIANISLDFMAGYTSFRPTRELTLRERATISFAGPGVHIATSAAVLVAMGHNPIWPGRGNLTSASAAIWWAGPLIGALNLIPVLPLDGGHIVESALERFMGTRAHRMMAIASISLTGAGVVAAFLHPTMRGFAIFIAFLLFAQVQILQASNGRAPQNAMDVAAKSEADAWQSGQPTLMANGQVPSPWFLAARAMRSGDPNRARDLLTHDLASPGDKSWWPPLAAPVPILVELIDVLPRPLPHGHPYSEWVLAEMLLRCGRYVEAGQYAAEMFAKAPTATGACMVARASAAAGDRDNAVDWLRAGANASHTASELSVGTAHPVADTVDHAPELASLRNDAEVRRIRAGVAAMQH